MQSSHGRDDQGERWLSRDSTYLRSNAAKGKQPQSSPEQSPHVERIDLTFELPFSKFSSDKPVCSFGAVPGRLETLDLHKTDFYELELPNDDSLVQHLAAKNLTDVRLVELLFRMEYVHNHPETAADLERIVRTLVPLLEKAEISFRTFWNHDPEPGTSYEEWKAYNVRNREPL
ncbi:uncharacterized protein LTR77_002969 [Saxophila tyrrhenica]|uniref:Uncharacterized protein n=1 Tax=Saxophila tyrrhenica TaxID=1690608 RepID=A0AAV9PIV9_9PEZI|nr:hypothetical protein LTR77_002969 [Saxophila tyrrhenica]